MKNTHSSSGRLKDINANTNLDLLTSQQLESSSTWYNTLLLKTFSNIIRVSKHVPQHIGFIMDGNRRYAKKQHIKVKQGHDIGFFSMCSILELCYECGVKSATVFAFSIENFKRDPTEVVALMELAKTRILQIVQNGDLCAKYGIRVKIVGDKALLDKDVLTKMEEAERLTESNTRATLNICFPYTGRCELYQGMKDIIQDCENGTLDYNDVTETTIDDYLYTKDDPPVDLLVRTSGVKRLSDFLIWQAQKKGVVLEFLDYLWPEFTPYKMWLILLKYAYNKTLASDKNNNTLHPTYNPDFAFSNHNSSTEQLSSQDEELERTC